MSERKADIEILRASVGDALTTSHIGKQISGLPEHRSFATAHIQKAVQEQNKTPQSGSSTTSSANKKGE